jgi:hypothetical protein
MKTLSCFISLILTLSYSDDLCAFQRQSGFIDSASVTQRKIKEKFKEVKKKKAQPIRRIVTEDSTIIYGADRNRTHIMHVSSLNKLTERHVQFTYNELGVIWIGVLRRPKKVNGEEKKHRRSAYYFDKGNLIYSKDGNPDDDIPFLLSEADRYLMQGRRFLVSHD